MEAPSSTPGGVFADILNYSPWVEPGSLATAWTMLTLDKHNAWAQIGWIEFHPLDGEGMFLRTDQETTQPNRTALAYWASGLEPVYFEGAFNRAAEFVDR